MSCKTGKELLLARKRDMLTIYQGAIAAVKPDVVVDKNVHIDDKNNLSITNVNSTSKNHVLSSNLSNKTITTCLKGKNLHILGAGKSTLSMVETFCNLKNLTKANIKTIDGCLSLPKKQQVLDSEILRRFRIDCNWGALHNEPDDDSVNATSKMLNYIDSISETNKGKDVFLFFLSGGASACLTGPRFIDFKLKQKIIKCVKNKCGIIELNRVRRFFSSVKQGRFAQFVIERFPEAELVTIIISDIVGDPIEYLGSGPTYMNSTDEENEWSIVCKILKKCNFDEYEELLEIYEAKRLESSDPKQMEYGRVKNVVIANSSLAVTAAKNIAKDLGYDILEFCEYHQTDNVIYVNRLFDARKRYRENKNQPFFCVSGGELDLRIEEHDTFGIGGRCQEVAMVYMEKSLNENILSNNCVDVFMAGSTDGQDGPTDVAGCFASKFEWLNENKKSFTKDQLQKGLRNHESNCFWVTHKPDWLIKTGMTGTNVMDLYMLIE